MIACLPRTLPGIRQRGGAVLERRVRSAQGRCGLTFDASLRTELSGSVGNRLQAACLVISDDADRQCLCGAQVVDVRTLKAAGLADEMEALALSRPRNVIKD